MIIKKLNYSELMDALPLVWNVFCKYEAPSYPEESKQQFKKAIYDENYLAVLDAWGAFENDALIGIIATRDNGKHVALFFVDGRYHKKGIGKKLWNKILQDNSNKKITVHSSQYAIPIYERLGFTKSGDIQTEDDITYLPMFFER